MKWENREPGPICFCGMHTCVIVSDNQVYLLCLFHSSEFGITFPLPKNKKPVHWPDVSDEEMKILVDEGIMEQEVADQI